MKIVRALLATLAAVVLVGAVASATPSLEESEEPAPEVSASPSPESTPATEAAETPSPDPTETSPSGDDVDGEDVSAAPDFSVCAGLTGLENAICRHEALLLVKPDHLGLLKSLDRLRANLEEQATRHAEETSDGTETSTDGTETSTDGTEPDGTDPASSCPGHSCEAHGNGNANGHSKH